MSNSVFDGVTLDSFGIEQAWFDKQLSSEENLEAKRRLRRYYRWRFGELPPRDWQADHQIEQHARSYLRFSGKYVHNLANLIYVPADINAGKNHWYARDWRSVPLVYRPFAEVIDTRGRISSETSAGTSVNVRDALHFATQFLDDDFAFGLLTKFSRSMLLRMIRVKLRTSWKTDPPAWLVESPQWLDRLRDEIENHMTYVAEYYRANPPSAPRRVIQPATQEVRKQHSPDELQLIWDSWPNGPT